MHKDTGKKNIEREESKLLSQSYKIKLINVVKLATIQEEIKKNKNMQKIRHIGRISMKAAK